jgi:hypothetical protein
VRPARIGRQLLVCLHAGSSYFSGHVSTPVALQAILGRARRIVSAAHLHSGLSPEYPPWTVIGPLFAGKVFVGSTGPLSFYWDGHTDEIYPPGREPAFTPGIYTFPGDPIQLSVSSDETSVTVSFPGNPPLYCFSELAPPLVRASAPAPIAADGGFSATVDVDPMQLVTGRFSGETVAGSIKTTTSLIGCGGSNTFTATITPGT